MVVLSRGRCGATQSRREQSVDSAALPYCSFEACIERMTAVGGEVTGEKRKVLGLLRYHFPGDLGDAMEDEDGRCSLVCHRTLLLVTTTTQPRIDCS